MIRKSKARDNSLAPQPKRSLPWLELVTLAIALWGAVLSSYMGILEFRRNRPMLNTRIDVQLFDRERPKFNMFLAFDNVGNSDISLDPHISVIAVNPKTKETDTFRFKAAKEKDKPVDWNAFHNPPAAPIVLKPGETAFAENQTSNALIFDTNCTVRILMSTVIGDKLETVFYKPTYVGYDMGSPKDNPIMNSWIGVSMARQL